MTDISPSPLDCRGPEITLNLDYPPAPVKGLLPDFREILPQSPFSQGSLIDPLLLTCKRASLEQKQQYQDVPLSVPHIYHHITLPPDSNVDPPPSTHYRITSAALQASTVLS